MKESQFDLLWKKIVVRSVGAFIRLSASAVMIRPYALTLFAGILTVVVARIISYKNPQFHWEPQAGLHVHHYVFGIFASAIAGYLALVFKGPRASFWIALLYGFGLGLVFDEFGLWMHLQEGHDFRWSNTGLLIVGGVFITGIAWKNILNWRPRGTGDESFLVARGDTENDFPG